MKLSKRQRRLWQYSINQLKKNFSPGVPVTVKTAHLKGISAECEATMHLGRMTGIVIRIDPRQNWKLKLDALMHEWAHAMEWSAIWLEDSPKKDHGETWGVWYSKIYRHLIDDHWEDMKERGLIHKDQMDLE
jgi:hypothetical protein